MKTYSVWDSVKIFYWLVKGNGYISFSPDGPIENGKIKSNPVDILITILANSVLLYILYINYSIDLSLMTTGSFIIDKGTRLVSLSAITNVFVSSVINTLRRHQIWSIFKSFDDFDKKIRTLSMAIDHKRIFYMFLLLLSSSALALSACGGFTYYLFYKFIDVSEKHMFFLRTYLCVNGSTTLCLVTFLLILHCFYVRFDLINACIKQNFKTHEDDVRRVSKGGKSLAATVMKLADLHDGLVDTVMKMNHCFSFQMMTIVGGMFCINIFSTFSIYRVFVKNDYQNFYKASVQSGWNVYFLIYGFCIIAMASLVTRTGKLTAVLVHKAINFIDYEDDPIIDTLKLFSQQMMHREPVVSCGLFVFDFTLMFTILGATATYIVILIQFDSDTGSRNSSDRSFANNTLQ